MAGLRPPSADEEVALDDDRVLGTRSRRALFLDGLLASASDVVNPYLPLYLVVLGASTAQVGLLAGAVGLAGLLALVPGAWIARRTRSHRWVVILGASGGSKLVLLLIAVTPPFLHGQAAIAVLIALGGLRVLATAMSHPAWMSLFASVVPERLTGRYNARRSLAAGIVAASAVPVAGWYISRGDGAFGFQVVFIVCALTGAVGALAIARIVEPARPAEERRRPEYRAVLADIRYRRYLLAMLLLHGSATMAGPFVVVYMVQSLGATTAEVGLMATGDTIAAVLGMALMSAVVARYSSRRLFLASIGANAMVPLLWLSIDAPWQAIFPVLLSGGAWSVCHLAVFNLLREYAPQPRIPEYVAAQQLAILGASFVGPLAGSVIVAHWGIVAVFGVSAVGRLLAIPAFAAPSPGTTWATRRAADIRAVAWFVRSGVR